MPARGGNPVYYSVGFPGGSDGKESTCNAGDTGSIPESGRSPGGGHGNPLQYSCLENPQGQRNLAGHSPWGHKGSDMTERLSPAQTWKWWLVTGAQRVCPFNSAGCSVSSEIFLLRFFEHSNLIITLGHAPRSGEKLTWWILLSFQTNAVVLS